jgi:hypothetical protein
LLRGLQPETGQQELFFPKENYGNTHIFGLVQVEDVLPSTEVSSFC